MKASLNSQLTPRGTTMLCGALGLALLGLVFIDGVLLTLGLAGLLVLCAALLAARANLRQLRVQLDAPGCVLAAANFPLTLSVLNRRTLLDAFNLEIELHLHGATTLGGFVRWIAAGSAADLRLRASVPLRGATSEHFCRIHSLAPLGLLRTTRSLRLRHDLLVFPRPILPDELQQLGHLHGIRQIAGAALGDAPGMPRGLRPYQPGDPARRIHWPASARALARGLGLMTRESDPPGNQPRAATLVFHSLSQDAQLIRVDQFERALSLAAGTLRQLVTFGLPTTLLADFNHWLPAVATSRGHLAGCNTVLALARRSNACEAHELQAALQRVPADHALVILSDIPPDHWQSMLPSLPRPPIILDIRQFHTARQRTLHSPTRFVHPQRRTPAR